MPWAIVRHWAELALILAVYHMFSDCHGMLDALKVVRDADDLTRLGMVTATAIASEGLAGMVKTGAHALGLPRGAEIIRRLLVRRRGQAK
jgi:hypothetical protein